MTVPPAALAGAARRWGTPIWVTDLDRAAANLGVVSNAIPGALVAYALKANTDSHLLRRLIAEGAGCEVVSAVELALARRAGCPPERLVMNGVGRRDPELREALAAGALVNAESLDDLATLLGMVASGGRARIGLRVNPALQTATHPHLATGSASAKFGIGLRDLSAALAQLGEAGIPLEAVGAHIGSEIADPDAYAHLVEILAEVERIAAAAGLAPARIDLGGGFAIADPALLRRIGALAADRFGGDRLIVEPGRCLVADAGWLVTRVVRVQARDERLLYCVADAGMTDLIRPVLYGAEHPVALLEPGEALLASGGLVPGGQVHLAGPVCEAGDILVRDLGRWLSPDALARAGRGALLAIGRAGAYGAAMSMTYNGRPRAAEAVLDSGEPRLSRRRETLEDIVARDV